jgi:hypothetical protein
MMAVAVAVANAPYADELELVPVVPLEYFRGENERNSLV